MKTINWKRVAAAIVAILCFLAGYKTGLNFPVAGIGLILAGIVMAIFGGTKDWFWVLVLWGLLILLLSIWYGLMVDFQILEFGVIGLVMAMIGGFIASRDHHGHVQ